MPLAEQLPDDTFLWNDAVEDYAVQTNSRVVAFDVLKAEPPALAAVADSQGQSSRDVAQDPTALRAVETGQVERGRVVDASGDFGEVAVPHGSEAVVLFRASLADSLATVRLVERRLLLATAFALLLALVLGLTAAGMLARRVQRLETAAERIASGDFGAPIVDRADDEIGQLAVAFDRMRVQLAQLDTARKEFVANASHELRTPLFSLGGFLELLTDEDLDEKTREEFLQTMRGQVDRLTKLSPTCSTSHASTPGSSGSSRSPSISHSSSGHSSRSSNTSPSPQSTIWTLTWARACGARRTRIA